MRQKTEDHWFTLADKLVDFLTVSVKSAVKIVGWLSAAGCFYIAANKSIGVVNFIVTKIDFSVFDTSEAVHYLLHFLLLVIIGILIFVIKRPKRRAK